MEGADLVEPMPRADPVERAELDLPSARLLNAELSDLDPSRLGLSGAELGSAAAALTAAARERHGEEGEVVTGIRDASFEETESLANPLA